MLLKFFLNVFGLLFIFKTVSAQNSDLAFGADLSFLKQVEEKGLVFKDSGMLKPGLQIFKDHGSFYPWSHGTLIDLKENLTFASTHCWKNKKCKHVW